MNARRALIIFLNNVILILISNSCLFILIKNCKIKHIFEKSVLLIKFSWNSRPCKLFIFRLFSIKIQSLNEWECWETISHRIFDFLVELIIKCRNKWKGKVWLSQNFKNVLTQLTLYYQKYYVLFQLIFYNSFTFL